MALPFCASFRVEISLPYHDRELVTAPIKLYDGHHAATGRWSQGDGSLFHELYEAPPVDAEVNVKAVYARQRLRS